MSRVRSWGAFTNVSAAGEVWSRTVDVDISNLKSEISNEGHFFKLVPQSISRDHDRGCNRGHDHGRAGTFPTD